MRRGWLATVLIVALAATLPALAGAEAATDEGMQLYDKKCAMCHGKDGVAKKMAAGSANLNDPEWQKATSEADLVKVIVEGKGKMPKYEGKLTHEQITAVARYVKNLK